VIKDDNGTIVEIKAEYHPDSKSGSDTSGIKVKSAIQWVEAERAKEVEVRVYDRLFKNEAPEGMEDLNPNSLKIIKNALIEPAVITERPDVRFQFEREGYFYADPVDYTDDTPVFNKIVSLKDSWAKKKKAPQNRAKAQPKKVQIDGEVAPMSEEEQALFDRYTDVLKLNSEVANTLARDKKLSSFYEETLSFHNSPVAVANIVANEVARELKQKERSALQFGPKEVAALVEMIDKETISTKIAKEVFEQMRKNGEDPTHIVEEKGLKQISDPDEILPIIDEVIAKNPDNVQKYREGNSKLFGFFVGQVLKATGGKANPKVVNELVKQQLG
jgi:glutaminyl-tRNA synthetase